VVDFQKGERYVKIKGATDPLPIVHNADQYGLFDFQCIGIPHRTHECYDVTCQWSINFHQCVQDSHFLSLPHITDLIPAVGKFHLEAHMPRCFARFILNFSPGTGQLHGEVLETLFSEFNKASASACSMSKAHRAEVYDDHMRDANWKKLVGMGK